MKLLFITLALSIGLSSALDKVLTFTKISRILIDSGELKADEPHFEIEVTGGVGSMGGYKKWHLNILTADGATQYQGYSVDSASSKDKATFKGNLAEVIESLPGNVEFVLTQRNGDDNPVSYGDLTFELPEFPEDDLIGAWVGDKNHIVSLRVAEKSKLHAFQIVEGDSAIDCIGDDTPCYFVQVSKETSDPKEFCKAVGAISICDKTIVIANEAFTEATVNEAELKYPASGNGLVNVKPAGTRDTVVYMKEADNVKQDSIIVCVSATCDIGTYEPSTDTHEVLVVDTSANPPTDSKIIEITDYELVGSPLSTTLLEVRWTKLAAADNYNHFWVVRDDPTKAGFTETSVTCLDSEGLTDGDPMHCFGYFTTLTGNKDYKVTINPSTDGTEANKDKTNTITLTGTHMPASEMKMELSSLTTKLNKGLKSLEIDACVHVVDSTDLSSYEAILINNIGQWKKMHGLSQRASDGFCFDEINVDVHNFNISEDLTLVVVKRANDGITVLESVETVISV